MVTYIEELERHPGIPPPLQAPPPVSESPRETTERRRRRERGPQVETDVDPRTGEPPRRQDPCDFSPMHTCDTVGYPFDSFEAAQADVLSRHPRAQPGATRGSTTGDCFKDGNPRSEEVARASGATHTTYRIPGVSGVEGVVASIVCCNCCHSIPESELPQHRQTCAVVKEREP